MMLVPVLMVLDSLRSYIVPPALALTAAAVALVLACGDTATGDGMGTRNEGGGVADGDGSGTSTNDGGDRRDGAASPSGLAQYTTEGSHETICATLPFRGVPGP